MFGNSNNKPFIWGDTPPKWFMKHIAEAFRLMGAHHEMVHAVDISDKWTVMLAIMPRDQSDALGVEVAEVFKRRFPETENSPPERYQTESSLTLLEAVQRIADGYGGDAQSLCKNTLKAIRKNET